LTKDELNRRIVDVNKKYNIRSSLVPEPSPVRVPEPVLGDDLSYAAVLGELQDLQDRKGEINDAEYHQRILAIEKKMEYLAQNPSRTVLARQRQMEEDKAKTVLADKIKRELRNPKAAPGPPPADGRRDDALEAEEARLVRELEESRRKGLVKDAERDRKANALIRARLHSVDVCFVLDITGSMKPHLESCQQKIIDILSEVKKEENFQDANIRFALVGYRDQGDEVPIQKIDFQTDPSEIQKFALSLSCSGGDDGPEDLQWGLAEALTLRWSREHYVSRLMIVITDAPCHGRQYHDPKMRENWPDETKLPHGHTMPRLLEDIRKNKIDLTIAQCNQATNEMVNAFRKLYNSQDRTLNVIELAADSRNFLPVVRQSIMYSVRNTERAYMSRQSRLHAGAGLGGM